MMESIEDLSSSFSDSAQSVEVSQVELDFIGECVSPPMPEELAMRIDDITGGVPPKAIDRNPEIAEMIEPIRDQIPSSYLEAPTDMEQVDQISDVLVETPELRPENWVELSLEDKVAVLNDLECKIAEIEHRPACPISAKDMGPIERHGDNLFGSMGVHTTSIWGESITVNSRLLNSDNPLYFKEALDTLVHEGRHSYQNYNLYEREIHTSQGDLTNWRRNLDGFGYQNAQKCGFKLYWMQPIEADARKFAEDVLTAYYKKYER